MSDKSKKSKKSKDKSSQSKKDSNKVIPTPECLKTDGYQLHEMLGEGSYSNVYRATNLNQPGVNYACKVYKVNPKTIKWVERCLHRELNLAMKVRHRSIVQAHFAIKAGDNAYLIIQFAPNGSIRDYLRKKLPTNVYLTESKVRLWMVDIFSAVAYLHAQEIAHRDIKTDNFLLTEEMKPLLADFSFACISDKADTRFECMVNTVCGTPSYLAPEVHTLERGQKYDGKLSDVFGLGICLYEMHVKAVPYKGKDFKLGSEKLVELEMSRDYSYPPHVRVSEQCRDLIYLLLEPNPRKRISVNQALTTHAWFTEHKVVSSKKSTKQVDSSENFRKQTEECKSTKSKKSTNSSKSRKSSISDKSTKSKKSTKKKETKPEEDKPVDKNDESEDSD